MKFHLIDEHQLKKLNAVATRLYSENRLNGDEMRDLAHVINAVTRVCAEYQMPDDLTSTDELPCGFGYADGFCRFPRSAHPIHPPHGHAHEWRPRPLDTDD